MMRVFATLFAGLFVAWAAYAFATDSARVAHDIVHSSAEATAAAPFEPVMDHAPKDAPCACQTRHRACAPQAPIALASSGWIVADLAGGRGMRPPRRSHGRESHEPELEPPPPRA